MLDKANTIDKQPLPNLKDAEQYIRNLDLTYIGERLARNLILKGWTRTKGWTSKEIAQCIENYKNYLFIVKKYNTIHLIIPPSKAIDEVWHQHILFTKEYHRDCLNIFGFYLHHEPGKGDKASYENFQNHYQNVTKKLFYDEFKINLTR